MEPFLLALVGLLGGVIMSFIGASAVMVVVPSLNLLGYGMHVSIGVSLLVDVLASLAVGYTYWRHGNVDLSGGLWIALGSILGAQLGAGVTVALPEWFLAVSYALWMIGSGVAIWKKGLDRRAIVERLRRYVEFDSQSKRIAAALALGFGIGVNCGVFGAGGGILIMMVLIFVFDYAIHKAVGTSTIIMAITAASGAAGYWMRGNINPTAALIVASTTILGGVSGAKLANILSEKTLSRIVGATFIILGIVLTWFRLTHLA